MDRISDDGEGTASNLYLNPGYDYAPVFNNGIAVNNNWILIEGIEGLLGTPITPPVLGDLYSFDYTVSEFALHNEIINIFADPSGGAINEVDIIGLVENVTPESLYLTVWIPEPGTISLLIIGSLFLKTRKHS